MKKIADSSKRILGNDFYVQEIVRQNGKKERKYFYKDKRALRAPIITKDTKKLAGYTLIEKDLRNILVWLNEIDKLIPEKKSNTQLLKKTIILTW